MNEEQGTKSEVSSIPIKIVGVNYVSLYVKDFEAAVEFYSRILDPPTYKKKETYGWKMGTTWLTIFPSKYGTAKGSNPCNAEFAIQVTTSEAVDELYEKFLEAGARDYCPPEDTKMYESMRFACVDDPFGMRIDVYCPNKRIS
jgi:catechol 2,3-dioxygenase-like lactoylglutathione lyase family enzyme